MQPDVPALRRALELARSGECISVNHVRQRLRREGYLEIATDLRGPGPNRQIIEAIKLATATP